MSEWIKIIEKTDLEIIDGDRGKNYPKQEEFRNNGYCLFLNAKNVTSSGFRFDELNFISQERDSLLRKGKLTREDIILTTRGTIGNVAYYGKEIPFENMRINSGMIIIRTKEEIDFPKYIYYQFLSKFMQEQITQFATGSAQPQIPISSISKLSIILPHYNMQKAIAKVLSSFDDKIENCNKIIANLNAQIETLFKNWFIDYAPFADNLSEEGIPKSWRNSNVFDESEEVRERNTDNDNIPVLSVVKDGEFVLSEDRFTKQVYSKKQTKYKIVSRNQIGFNPARANIGSIAMLTDFDIGLVSPIYIVFKLKNSILPTYFYYYMKRPVFLQNIQAQAIGTTRQNLSYDAFKLFPIVVPTEKAQKNFIDLITPMEQEIANQKKQIEKLANTRDTLLPKLMSGEIEVPVEEKL